ncbi:hypothetical protein [Allokutzneria oryzae]|uniref:Metalloprotease n=1 Tax=Allokutzneria oryzae TaxID=1378989 RepID=A0ABV6A9U8_9PSEU
MYRASSWRVAAGGSAILLAAAVLGVVPAHGAEPASTCVKGGAKFSAPPAPTQPNRYYMARHISVTVLGNSGGGLGELAKGTTGTDGQYRICFAASRLNRLIVRLATENDVWATLDKDNNPYGLTASLSDVPAAAEVDFGVLAPTGGDDPAWHAFDTLNNLFPVVKAATGCWTANDAQGACRKILMKWWPGSTEPTEYRFAENTVYLSDKSPDSQHIVLHEAGHSLMWKLFDHTWWPDDNCAGHQAHRKLTRRCAWTEGFADAVAGHIKGDNAYVDENGGTVDLVNHEPHDPGKPLMVNGPDRNWNDGDDTQGRVAGSLLEWWAYPGSGGLKGTVTHLDGSNNPRHDNAGPANFEEYYGRADMLNKNPDAKSIFSDNTITY